MGVTISEFRIGGRGQVNCNTLWGMWTCLQVCKQGCKKVKGIYTTKKSVDWPGLIIRLSGSRGNADVKYLNQLERGRDVILRYRENVSILFNVKSNYINKANIICT